MRCDQKCQWCDRGEVELVFDLDVNMGLPYGLFIERPTVRWSEWDHGVITTVPSSFGT